MRRVVSQTAVVLLSTATGTAAVAGVGALHAAAPARSSAHEATTLILGPPRNAPRSAPRGAARGAPAEATPRSVGYRGVRVPVPAGWAVVRLDEDPSACVRYDRHAVYLGRPGPQPDCPARVVGRTESVHVQPLDDVAASRTVVHADKLGSFTVKPSVGHETSLALPEAGMGITGVYGTDPAALQRILRGTRVTAKPHGHGTPPAQPQPQPQPHAQQQPPAHAQPQQPQEPPKPAAPPSGPAARRSAPADPPDRLDYASGKGFDTCTAPSLSTMKAWRSSFDVTNIYIGGAARGCEQPNLTAAWVKKVRKMGYRILPTYVGLQPPCGTRPQKFTTRNAASQGKKTAADAVAKAKALGIPADKPIYLDLEAYKSKNATCKAAVLRFVNAWIEKVRQKHYKPCLYGSASSGVRDVGAAEGIAKPVGIWFANWDGKARVYGDRFLPDDWWPPHRRIKQYRGAHKERHGGVTLNIDSSIADGRAY
ncbi:glycoside hydrolase domain-containing protein [Actinomadura nitritigenes]|uniref:glycoside hydrolase domain-containing protein n=1 Tax=Actinomadura nitritigenes TaxID=134602 RepID=UPI003D913082